MSLKEEIETGPLASSIAPFLSINDDSSIVTILNEKTIDAIKTIDRRTFVHWCAKSGMRAVIQDVSIDVASPLRSSALAMLDIILGGGTEGIDFGDQENIDMLNAWVALGELTPENKTALLALATVKISRAELILGRDATIYDVASAVRDGAGNSLMGV